VRRKFSCHIDIKQYFVRELVLTGVLKLVQLRTHTTVADALAKACRLPLTSYVLRGLIVMILSADFERCVCIIVFFSSCLCLFFLSSWTFKFELRWIFVFSLLCL